MKADGSKPKVDLDESSDHFEFQAVSPKLSSRRVHKHTIALQNRSLKCLEGLTLSFFPLIRSIVHAPLIEIFNLNVGTKVMTSYFFITTFKDNFEKNLSLIETFWVDSQCLV